MRLDDMVMAGGEFDFEPGDRIRRVELHDRYGGSRQGGISPSRSTPNVFVFTDPSTGRQHGYFDKWEGEIFHYYGEGQRGDQRMVGGNRAILDHVDHARSLRVFEGSSGVVTYVGEFGLDAEQPWYIERAPETGGGPLRNVIVFRLIPSGEIHYRDARVDPSRTEVSLSAAYIPLDEEAGIDGGGVYEMDPIVAERGLRGHRVTQNRLAEWVESRGAKPVRPDIGDPPFDAGWWLGDVFVVAEVKSVTLANRTTQLRLGLGQVLDYSFRLNQSGVLNKPVLVSEIPVDEQWVRLCETYGVTLIWPRENGGFVGADSLVPSEAPRV